MTIYILLVLLVIQFIICYFAFGKDLFSPSAILCEVFILSTLACIYNVKTWGVNLQISTLQVILIGNLIFIVVTYIIHLLNKTKNKNKINEPNQLQYIDISNFKCLILICVYSLFAVFYIKANLHAVSSLSQITDDVSVAMNMYRRETVEGSVQLPSLLTELGVILNIGIYVLLYVFINNTIVNHKKFKNYIFLLCTIIYLVSSAFSAQRTTILLAFIYSLFIIYELLNRKYSFASKLNNKYVICGMAGVIIFLLLFGVTRGLVGRTDERSVVENITYYMGNSIESLDLYIKHPVSCKQFGEELFRQFRVTLSKFGLCEDTTMKNGFLEFRKDANGNSAGNVYTAYRYYIHDFGYESIIFFQIFIGIFYGIWYEKIKKRTLKNNIDIGLVMYAWFILCLFRFSLTQSFFTFLSYFIFTHWYVFVLWKILLTIKIKYNDIQF